MKRQKQEQRRLRFIELRDALCNGSNAAMGRAINREASYVTRLTYPDGKPGKASIGEDLAEVIERAFNLPKGWIDGDVEVRKESI